MPMPAHASCGSRLGSPSEFLQIPYGQSLYHVFRGEFDLAQRLDEDLLRLSRQRNDSGRARSGSPVLRRTLMFAGRFASSRSHLEEALALYDPISHRSLVHQAGVHPHVYHRRIWGLSFSVSAFRTRHWHRATQQSPRLGGWPIRRLWLGAWRSVPGAFARRRQRSLDERADQLVAVATEQGFPLWRAQGTIYRGWVKVKNGDVAEGISLLRSGSAAYRATGAEFVDALLYRPPGQGM